MRTEPMHYIIHEELERHTKLLEKQLQTMDTILNVSQKILFTLQQDKF